MALDKTNPLESLDFFISADLGAPLTTPTSSTKHRKTAGFIWKKNIKLKKVKFDNSIILNLFVSRDHKFCLLRYLSSFQDYYIFWILNLYDENMFSKKKMFITCIFSEIWRFQIVENANQMTSTQEWSNIQQLLEHFLTVIH